MSEWDSLEFEVDVLPETRGAKLVSEVAKMFRFCGIMVFTFTMLRHGWIAEKRIQWSVDAELRANEDHNFTRYVSRLQQWKSRETGDYYIRAFAQLLGKFSGSSMVRAWFCRVGGELQTKDASWRDPELFDPRGKLYADNEGTAILSESSWDAIKGMLHKLPEVREHQLEALQKPYIALAKTQTSVASIASDMSISRTPAFERELQAINKRTVLAMRRFWHRKFLEAQEGYFSKHTMD